MQRLGFAWRRADGIPTAEIRASSTNSSDCRPVAPDSPMAMPRARPGAFFLAVVRREALRSSMCSADQSLRLCDFAFAAVLIHLNSIDLAKSRDHAPTRNQAAFR